MNHTRHTAALICLWAVIFGAVARADQQTSPTDVTLQGTWIAKDGVLIMKLLLRPDHIIEWSVDSDVMVNTRPLLGRWHVEQGDLVIVWEGHKEAVKRPISEVTVDKLVVFFPDEAQKTTFHRVESLTKLGI